MNNIGRDYRFQDDLKYKGNYDYLNDKQNTATYDYLIINKTTDKTCVLVCAHYIFNKSFSHFVQKDLFLPQNIIIGPRSRHVATDH